MADTPSLLVREFPACFVCGYNLHGHLGSFACSECGTPYDGDTFVCYSPYLIRNPKHPVAKIVLFVAVGMPLIFASVVLVHKGPREIAAAFFAVLVIVNVWNSWRQIRQRTRQEKPFIAFTRNGLIVNRNGIPGDIEIVSWREVQEKYQTVGSGWKFTGGMIEDLGISLYMSDASILHKKVVDFVTRKV